MKTRMETRLKKTTKPRDRKKQEKTKMGIRKKNRNNTQHMMETMMGIKTRTRPKMKTMIKEKDTDKEEVNEVKDNGEDKDEGPSSKQGQRRGHRVETRRKDM